MPKYNTWITDPNPDEIRVEVEYYFNPAEPDVGYFSPSVEIESITETETNREIEFWTLDDNDLEEIEENILASFSESAGWLGLLPGQRKVDTGTTHKQLICREGYRAKFNILSCYL